jgi:CRISPR-associated endonuclease/helicase Cas3
MAELTAAQFADFFQAVHGYEPFNWQKRLAEQVLGKEGWPDVIRVPTSCGKTSVLDIALFELASRPGDQADQRTPARRICFVINRRLVVDEVTEHAHQLYQKIKEADKGKGDTTVLRSVATTLASLAADKDEPLRVVRLRGAVYRDDGWAADPLTPTILISTVDQIGSRLLFRGYGVSRRSRPLQAGLLAFDTRIILDEAHLSPVFAETSDRIRQYQQWAERSPLPRNRLVSTVRMSATVGESQRVFELKDEERQDTRLKPRLEASKSAELIPVEVESITKDMRQKQPRKTREVEKENRAKLVRRLVEKVKEFAGIEKSSTAEPKCFPGVIGVVVNRVATARQIFERLRQQDEGQPEREALLLTGRIRPYDRDRLLHMWLPKIKAGRDTNPNHPLIVVATQTVEVGANIDFDALVTEASPLDALRQRFGRLHRIPDKPGKRPAAMAGIIIRSDQMKNSEDDPIYGQSIAETWKWLNGEHNKVSKKKTSKKGKGQPTTVDFGINHLDPKLPKSPDDMRPMLAPQPEAPLLFPAHLDAWVQTNPTPDPDPDVGPFLHGAADADADVQVIWRADMDKNNSRAWVGIVKLMPPRIREALPVPLYELRSWLTNNTEESLGDVADIEGVKSRSKAVGGNKGRRVLRWRGIKKVHVVGPDKIKPGDVVVIPTAYGGADEFGWNPERKVPVPDIADCCLVQLIASYPLKAFRRPRLRLRLHRSLLLGLTDVPAIKERLEALLCSALASVENADADPWPMIKRLLQTVREQVSEHAQLAAVDALLQLKKRPKLDQYPERDGLVVSAKVNIELRDEDKAPIEDAEHEEPEGDEASLVPSEPSNATNSDGVLLTDHTKSVKKVVERFASHCGLGDEFKNALALAAQWHDEGKRDVRFQAWLHGSELKALTALANGKPLAKSGRDLDQWGRSDAFGYPRGMRHEFVSARLLEAAQGNGKDSESYDLAKLLVGTHHGFGRVFAPVVKDRKPDNVTLNHDSRMIAVSSDHRLYRIDSGWVDLFWRMVRRYGWWGLAYLESLLITADHLASAQEQQEPANHAEEPTA